jgi:L-alanine-DL-glutamate epimerase-like enolase superfamily enzyme
VLPDDTLPDGSPLRALLRGRDPADLTSLGRALAGARVRPEIVAAVDAAAHDLVAQAAGVPVYTLLGGRFWPELPVRWVVYIRPIREMEPEVAERVREGFTGFKLKVGGDATQDEARLRLIRDLAGPGASILLDANAAWGPDEAVAALRRLEPYRPAGIETPVAPDDLEGTRRVRRATPIPLVEHAGSLAQTLDYVRHDAVDVFCVYPPSYGGYRAAAQVLGVIAAAGKRAYLGSDVEMGIGTLALAQFAVASPECDALAWPCTQRGPLLLAADALAEPLRYEGDRLALPAGPGLASRLDAARLRVLAGDLAP